MMCTAAVGRTCAALAVALLALLALLAPAAAQIGGGAAPVADLYCYSGTVPTSPSSWAPCAAANPLAVTGTFTPSGTQDINIKQVQGAVPSLTNPLWIAPATGATFAVTSGAALTPVSSSSLAANTVIKASAGNLYSFEVSADSTLSAAAWWIMVYNATSAPVDGAVTPLKCYAMALGSTAFSAAFPTPVAFSTGITIGVSTTGCFTKTASTHAFISGDAQ